MVALNVKFPLAETVVLFAPLFTSTTLAPVANPERLPLTVYGPWSLPPQAQSATAADSAHSILCGAFRIIFQSFPSNADTEEERLAQPQRARQWLPKPPLSFPSPCRARAVQTPSCTAAN